jgi:hypothetical protein
VVDERGQTIDETGPWLEAEKTAFFAITSGEAAQNKIASGDFIFR